MQVFLPYKNEEFNVELVVLQVVGLLVSLQLIIESVQEVVIVPVLSVVLVQPTYNDLEEFKVELVSLQVVGSVELLQLVKKEVHEVMFVLV